jgi:hypothetical protein
VTVSITPSTLGPFSKITAIHFPVSAIPPGYPSTVYVCLLGGDGLGISPFQPTGAKRSFNWPYGSPCLDFGESGPSPDPIITPLVVGHGDSPPGYVGRDHPFNPPFPMVKVMIWKEPDPSGPGTVTYAGGFYLTKSVADAIAANPINAGLVTVQSYVWK